MKRITSYVRPHRLEELKAVLMDVEVSGLTVNDVRGCGNSPESSSLSAQSAGIIALPIRSKVTVIVTDTQVDSVVAAIVDCLRTESTGDGKIFVEPVDDAFRIRTGERGDVAL